MRAEEKGGTGKRDGLAAQRTGLAEDRTVLAAERTYTAWLRTGLAFLVTGLAAERFLHDVLPSPGLRLVAFLLLTCAFACFALAGWRHRRMRRRLPRAHIKLLPDAAALGLSGLLALAALSCALALWLR